MTRSWQDRARTPLAAVGDALLAAAQVEADQRLAAAAADAGAHLARAETDAERTVAEARAEAAAAADRIAQVRLAAARRLAHETVLAARRSAYEAVRSAAIEAVAGQADTIEARRLAARISERLRERLGPDATVHEVGPADPLGITAQAGNRRSVIGTVSLVDEALGRLSAEVEQLWA